MADTRSNVGKINLMHYLIELTRQTFDELPQWKDCCAHVYSACKVALSALLSTIKRLEASLENGAAVLDSHEDGRVVSKHTVCFLF